MKLKIYAFYLIFFSTILYAQISGTVIDSISGRLIEGVNITNGKIGTTTNKMGKFLIDIPIGTELEFSHIAYKSIIRLANNELSIKLIPAVIESDQITVRGGLSNEPFQDAVSSIYVFTNDEIRESGADHFQTLTEQIPNLNWAGATSRPRYFQIRGIGERSHYFGEGPPNFSVGFVIDDMDFSGLGMLGNLYDLEQIEIFRGPQSSVYGANALAGLISLKSKDPKDQFDFGVLARTGSDNHRSINNFINMKTVGNLSIRLTGGYNYSDGFRENISQNATNTNKKEEWFSRMKLNFTHSENFNVLTTIIYSELDNGYDAWAPNNNTDFRTYSDDKGLDSQTTYGYSIRTNIDTYANFTLITSFTETDLVHSYDSDWGDSLYWALNHNWNPESYPNDYYLYRYFDKTNKVRTNLNHELRTSFGPIILGFYYKDLNENDIATGWLFDGMATDALSDFNFKTLAGYTQYKQHFSSSLNMKLNLRVEQNKYDYTGTSQGYDENWEKISLDSVQFNTKEMMVGYRGSVTYVQDALSSYYISFSQGYKSGGINQQPYLTTSSRPYDPEYVQSFEFGLKRTTNTYRSNLTFFLSTRKNQQVSVSSQQEEGDPNSFLFYTGNAGSGKNNGIELEHSQQLLKSLSFDITIGVLNTWVDKFTYQTADGVNGGGNRAAAMAPEWMGSSGFHYSISDFYFHTNTTYKSEYYFSDSHNKKSKPYSLTNITFGRSFRQFDVKFWVRNIFDKRYAVRGFYFGLIPPEYDNELWLSYGDPRQLGLTLDYNF